MESTRTTAGAPNYGESSLARDLGEQLRELHSTEQIAFKRGDKNAAGVLVLPAGRTPVSIKKFLDEYLPTPERREGTARAFSLDSFIALFDRFATSASAVFANPDKPLGLPSLTAVFDYHPATVGEDRPTDWLKHRAVFQPQLSDEWKAWLLKNGTFMSQADFAAFMEDRITNVIVPNLDDPKLKTFAELVQGTFAEPADLVKLSRGLEVNVGSQVKSAVRLSSGEISIQYTETHSDGTGAPIKVPNLFQVCIPVFYAGEWYRMAAWLRYKVSGGSVSWAYQLVQPELVFKSAFEEMAKAVAERTNRPVLFGAPEQQ